MTYSITFVPEGDIIVTNTLSSGITVSEIATTIISKSQNIWRAYVIFVAILAKIVVPAVVPPARIITPIPSPTLTPPKMAFTMLFPVSTCHDSVKLKNIEIRIVTRIVKYILLFTQKFITYGNEYCVDQEVSDGW